MALQSCNQVTMYHVIMLPFSDSSKPFSFSLKLSKLHKRVAQEQQNWPTVYPIRYISSMSGLLDVLNVFCKIHVCLFINIFIFKNIPQSIEKKNE